ncbi:MAG: hypothetical protein H0W90_12000 [Actinobacteria bacterium]|nr:hypothetical protein [Actinomycetota bacterium]
MARRAIATVALGLALALPAAASAHNRAHIILPNGSCVTVGSEKSVALPDNAAAPTNSAGLRDLRPETPADEIGTSFAATQGNSAIEKGACP